MSDRLTGFDVDSRQVRPEASPSASSAWQYVRVRRFFVFLERTLDCAVQWAVFEPKESTAPHHMAMPKDARTKPTFIPPMLATLVGAPFDDPGWLFEVKWDGFRAEAVVDDDAVRLWTRGEKDAAQSYFGPFLDPPTWIGAKSAVVDGEVIALDERGEPDFALLQARIKGRGVAAEPTPFVYEVFDLLHLDGRSLLDEPLEERRGLLAGILRPDPRVRLSEHIEGDGIAFFEAARVRGLEGIMAKDRRSPYVPGKRTDRWQKVKIRPEQELVVGGWVAGTGKAIELGALLIGVHEDGELRYAGKIGAGFTNDNRAELLAAVAKLAADDPPFASPPPRAASRNAHWLRPELVIRAEFAGWTSDGLVRQAAFKGIELEKDPRRVIRERPRT
jgi:bifunctional non-homologous end joining protein LigD